MKFYDILVRRLEPYDTDCPCCQGMQMYASYALCTVQGEEEALAQCAQYQTMFPDEELYVGEGYTCAQK